MPYARRSLGGTSRRRATSARRSSAARASKVATSRKRVVKTVRREINRMKETGVKVIEEPRTQYNNAASVGADLRPLLSSIVQAGQSISPLAEQPNNIESREGKSVVLRALTVRGLVSIPPIDSASSADRAHILCRLVCFSSKRYPTYDEMTVNWAGGTQQRRIFLRSGATVEAFVGAMRQMWLPVNREAFTVHYDKSFYMARGMNIPYGTGDGAAHMPVTYKPFGFSMKVRNKVLKYQQETDGQPSNFGPCLYLMWSYCNGAPGSAAAVPYMQYNAMTRWKD